MTLDEAKKKIANIRTSASGERVISKPPSAAYSANYDAIKWPRRKKPKLVK